MDDLTVAEQVLFTPMQFFLEKSLLSRIHAFDTVFDELHLLDRAHHDPRVGQLLRQFREDKRRQMGSALEQIPSDVAASWKDRFCKVSKLWSIATMVR